MLDCVELLELLERADQMAQQAEQQRKTYPTISVSCEQDLRDAVEKLANEEDRPIGAMARILIKEALRSRGLLPDEADSSTSQ